MRWLAAIGFVLALLSVTPTLADGPPAWAVRSDCTFQLGFKALRDQIPEIVGDCLTIEYTPFADTLQNTTGGLLVWRKADNWTAFTDGALTWINGPNGIQSRPNAGPLFAWEGGAPSAAPLPSRGAAEMPSGLTRPTGLDTSAWLTHNDADKSFTYPPAWRSFTARNGVNYYLSPIGGAGVLYQAPYQMGPDAKVSDFLGRTISAWAANQRYTIGALRSEAVNGFPAEWRFVSYQGDRPSRAWVVAIQRGRWVHYVVVFADQASWDGFEPGLLAVVRSYYPKGD